MVPPLGAPRAFPVKKRFKTCFIANWLFIEKITILPPLLPTRLPSSSKQSRKGQQDSCCPPWGNLKKESSGKPLMNLYNQVSYSKHILKNVLFWLHHILILLTSLIAKHHILNDVIRINNYQSRYFQTFKWYDCFWFTPLVAKRIISPLIIFSEHIARFDLFSNLLNLHMGFPRITLKDKPNHSTCIVFVGAHGKMLFMGFA